MTGYTFTVEPHPTASGKVLAVTPKPESWRCDTETEKALYAIGGKPYRFYSQPGERVAFTLSPAQARDVDTILRAGYRSNWAVSVHSPEPDEYDFTFWHPDEPDGYLTRAEVLALISPPARCRRTLELPLAA